MKKIMTLAIIGASLALIIFKRSKRMPVKKTNYEMKFI